MNHIIECLNPNCIGGIIETTMACKICGSNEWSYNIQDVDGENEKTHIECKKCGVKSFQG